MRFDMAITVVALAQAGQRAETLGHDECRQDRSPARMTRRVQPLSIENMEQSGHLASVDNFNLGIAMLD